MLNKIALFKHFFDALWEYDPQTKRLFMYHDRMLTDACNQWVDYKEIYTEHLNHFVYWEDIGEWEENMSIAALEDFLKSDLEEVHFSVRIKNDKNELQWHEAYLERYQGHVIIGSRDVRDEQRNAIIAQAVLSEFDYVCRINVQTGSYMLYYADNKNTIVPQHKADDYEQVIGEFNRQYVVDHEAELLTENMRINKVVQELKNKSEYVLFTEVKTDINPLNSFKRLRFRYEDERHKVILLTRTDISEFVRERQKREKMEKRYQELLTNMPIAICSTEVLLDQEGKPYDFRYTYCNPAHEKLEGAELGELLGKGFYEFFENADSDWLDYYYETAWLGIPHVIRKYSPEIGKDLLIHTFRTEQGHCDCVVQDVTRENFLFKELHQSREELIRVLETTTAAVFHYNPATDELQQNDFKLRRSGSSYHANELFDFFLKEGRINAETASLLKDCFDRIKKGEHSLSVPLRCTKRHSKDWVWYKLSLFDYQDETSNERLVLGYIQDINRDMKRQTKLMEQAQMDALTGILNVGEGRSRIQKQLTQLNNQKHAFFIIDVDNFKIVNDTYGHLVGDKTLVCFADILSTIFHDKGIVYRLGGDEFAVFMPCLEDQKQVEILLEKLQSEVEKAKHDFPFLNVSVGVYISHTLQTYNQLYALADKALYQTKKNNKGNYTIINE